MLVASIIAVMAVCAAVTALPSYAQMARSPGNQATIPGGPTQPDGPAVETNAPVPAVNVSPRDIFRVEAIDGRRRADLSSRSNNEADVDAVISIDADAERLAAVLQRSGDPMLRQRQAAEYRENAQKVRDFLKATEVYLRAFNGLREVMGSDGDKVDTGRTQLQNAMLNVIESGERLVSNRSEKEQQAFFQRLDATAGDNFLFEAAELRDVLRVELDRHRAETLAFETQLASATNLGVRMRARLRDGEGRDRALKIDNYTSAAVDGVTLHRRISLEPTEEEQAALDANKETVKQATDTNVSKEALKEGVAADFNDFADKLVALAAGRESILSDLPSRSDLETNLTALADNERVGQVNAAAVSLATIRATADSMKASVNELNAEIRRLKTQIQAGGQTAAGAMAVALRSSWLTTERAKELVANLETIGGEIQKIRGIVESFTETASLTDQQSTFFDTLKEGLGRLETIADVPTALRIAADDDARKGAEAHEAFDDFTPEDVEAITVRRASDLPPSQIRLAEYAERKEGDSVEIVIETLERDETGQDQVTNEQRVVFRLKSYGWNDRFRAIPIFARDTTPDIENPEPDGDTKKKFFGTVAASWTVKYTPRKKDWVRRIVSDPAFGFHTAVLEVGEEETQVGVGGTMSLFVDTVHVGVGRNMQRSDDAFYWYFGLGVTSLIDHIRGE